MATKILVQRRFILAANDQPIIWQDIEGNAEDNLDTHLNSGWKLLSTSSSLFNNEKRVIFTIEL